MEYPSFAQVLVGVLIAGAVGWMLIQRRNASQWSSRRTFGGQSDETNDGHSDWNKRSESTGGASSRPMAELSGLHFELYEQIRDAKAELDSKAHVLQSLIRLCSEESDRLEKLILCAKAVEIPLTSPASSLVTTTTSMNPEIRQARRPSQLLDRDLAQQVYRLSDTGNDPKQIAGALGLPEVDVELLLNLRTPR